MRVYARRRMRNEARIGLGQFTVCSSLATHWRKHHVQQSVNRSVNAGQTAATLKVNDLRGSLQTFQQFSVVITPRQDHCSRLQSALFAAPAVLKTDRQTDMQHPVNTVYCCLPGPPSAPSSWRLKADIA